MQAQAKMERATASHAVLAGPVPEDGNRLRVLHVISYMGRGGAEMGILKLIAGLGEEFVHRICYTRGFVTDFVLSHIFQVILYGAQTADTELYIPLFRL